MPKDPLRSIPPRARNHRPSVSIPGTLATPPRLTRRLFVCAAYVGLVLVLLNIVSGIADSPLAYAASTPHAITLKGAPSTPNTQGPAAGSTSHTRTFAVGAPGTQPPHAPVDITRNVPLPMKAGTVPLQVGKVTDFLGSDGRLEVQVPAGAITAQDVSAAGGTISMHVTQVAPASGSNAGGSGELSFGTFLVQLTDAQGHLLSHGLRTPLSVFYHLKKGEAGLHLEHAFLLLNGAVAPGATKAQGVVSPATGTSLAQTMGKQLLQKASLDKTGMTLSASPQVSTSSSSLSFDGSSPIATFGKPDPTSVDLSAGALSYSEPISLPAGPGGFTPPVSLTYSSEAVNGQHNASAGVGWVGEGWNLSLGSISWSEQNVTANCTGCTATWQSAWQLNDAFGTSSALIPPDEHTSTYYDDTPNAYCATGNTPSVPCPILWHTATESHAKIYAYVGPLSIGQPNNPPCFRVWLPNGIMEEFGCTLDSLQYYYEAGLGALVTGWYLDLITDPQGNQIHVTYQRDMENWTSPTTGNTFTYPRDVALASVQYDSPGCHNAQSMCTGSSWAPQMQVVFNASHGVNLLTGTTPTGCNTAANVRCDDPVDLTNNNGLSTSLIQSTFVLNSVQVQVRSSGTGSWNTLRSYNLSYEQSGPGTITDPASGIQRSTAGMLDLTQIQQLGSGGASALLYSGLDTSASSSFAYLKVYDLSGKNLTMGPSTTLSYWIFPQSSTTSPGVSGNNSTCVAIDMVFTDGTDLRDSGAVDQNGNQLHPAHQCNHLTLDQWNHVTSDIGAKVNGKTLNRIDIGYDQAANTGAYRGYIDDISLTDPTSSTPLFATSLESGDPQPTWTNTVDNATPGGNITNVGGICCGLTGPELGTRQEYAHTDSAALPPVIFSYTTVTPTYLDSADTPTPTTNCAPTWNAANGACPLWSQGYAGNNRFLAAISNGQGLSQTFGWSLAHNNTHGVNGGGANTANPFYCNSQPNAYPCDEADDMGWSHAVLTQDSSTTVRLTQNGQGGAQSSTPITATTNYTYQLTYPLTAQECSDCVAGMYWGDQNDANILNYFDSVFMGFAQATVALPTGAVEVHKFYAGEGWGLYDTTQVTCFQTSPCHNDPWWDLANAAHGHEFQAQFYDVDGTTLLKQVNTTVTATCPPTGVSGTPNFDGFSFNGQLVSTMDINNPLAVCEIQTSQQITQTSDGASSPVTTTSNRTYDSFGRVTQQTTTSNGGTPGKVVQNTAYIWNDGITATQTSASGTYLIDTVAYTVIEDGSGNQLQCRHFSYDGQSYATGQSSGLTGGLVTSQDDYANCGTSANGYTPSGDSQTTTVYDAYGNPIGTNDADANAGISGHTGCSVNSVLHTTCATYDSAFAVFPVSTGNALNQTSSTSYANTAQLFGFGTWPVSTTDLNHQNTSFTYDALGRMTGEVLPGETSGDLTKQWSYTVWCSGTSAQTPCVEIDEIDRLDSSTTTITRVFYDGEGRLIETRKPGPVGQDIVTYVNYDIAGRQIFKSTPYFVTAYTGTSGAAAYSLPDSTQPGTSTTHPTLR